MKERLAKERIKVLIIDDSAVSRQTIRQMLEKVPAIDVVGVAADGYDGMNKIIKLSPDVVTLDLEMPKMDGFTVLRWVIDEHPLPVIVVSAHGDTSTVFKALEMGAVDFIVKPTTRSPDMLSRIEDSLLSKIMALHSLDLEKYKKTISMLKETEKKTAYPVFQTAGEFELVAIGASTGGPTALQTILCRLPKDFPGGIIISQHMPAGFTRQFAERMNRISEIYVKEAENGEPIEGGKVLICPGGYHMRLESVPGSVIVSLKESSPKDKYIPSIDVMMKSAAEIYKDKIIGIILTGMGYDGSDGMMEIKKMGGYTVVESEESSVVFGMPQAVIASGAADKVLPLHVMADEIINKVKRAH
jgi:two-component system chemotaxis response regulator CheB